MLDKQSNNTIVRSSQNINVAVQKQTQSSTALSSELLYRSRRPTMHLNRLLQASCAWLHTGNWPTMIQADTNTPVPPCSAASPSLPIRLNHACIVQTWWNLNDHKTMMITVHRSTMVASPCFRVDDNCSQLQHAISWSVLHPCHRCPLESSIQLTKAQE